MRYSSPTVGLLDSWSRGLGGKPGGVLMMSLGERLFTPTMPHSLQPALSNLDHLDSLGLNKIVQIIEGPDNQEYEY